MMQNAVMRSNSLITYPLPVQFYGLLNRLKIKQIYNLFDAVIKVSFKKAGSRQVKKNNWQSVCNMPFCCILHFV